MAETTDNTQVVTQEDQSTQNEYIITINKKIRALKKKSQNIDTIEKKPKEGRNEDQRKLLASKDQIIRQLQEFEAIRDSFVEIYNKEEKAPKEQPKPIVNVKVANEGNDSISSLITLLHVTQIFDRTRPEGIEARKAFFAENKAATIKTDADIDNIFYIMHSLFGTPLAKAIDLGQKFASESEEEFNRGVTFKHLKGIVTDLANSYFFRSLSSGVPEQKLEEEAQPEAHEAQQTQQHQVVPEQQQHVEVTTPEQHHHQEVHVEDHANGQQLTEEEAQQENGEQNAESDEGYTTTERKRGGRGRGGRGGRGRGGPRGGNRGRGGFGSPRGARNFDNNRGRDFQDNRGGPRGGRDYFDNRGRDFQDSRGGPRGGRGGQQHYQQQQQQQQQQQKS